MSRSSGWIPRSRGAQTSVSFARLTATATVVPPARTLKRLAAVAEDSARRALVGNLRKRGRGLPRIVGWRAQPDTTSMRTLHRACAAPRACTSAMMSTTSVSKAVQLASPGGTLTVAAVLAKRVPPANTANLAPSPTTSARSVQTTRFWSTLGCASTGTMKQAIVFRAPQGS